MAEIFRRVIRKPQDAQWEQVSRLSEALEAAINAQNRLAAKSMHVLQLTGPLQEDDQSFYVDHEPARPLAVADLFDAEKPGAGGNDLLRLTAALADALSAAHATRGTRPVVHGALTPGTILTGEDGLIKVADFGFAAAICKTLGADHYLSLGIGTGDAGTGIWEALGPEVTDRDDRVCGFVDPDKYGSGTLASFEAGSDIIAVGILLYLIAEHTHPYLHMMPDAHRVVDMAQMMSFGVPLTIRREDLLSSDNPGLSVWCGLVEGMLARVPTDRPSASKITAAIQAFVAAVDVESIKADRWLEQLEAMLAARQWGELEALLKDRPALDEWPADKQARIEAVQKQFDEDRAEDERREQVQREEAAANEWFKQLRTAVNGEAWASAFELLDKKPQLSHWPEEIESDLNDTVAQISQVRAERELRAWHDKLTTAAEREDWSAVGQLLDERKPDDTWPDEVRESTEVIAALQREQLEAAERARQELAEAHDTARQWLEEGEKLADEEKWVATLDHLAELPPIEDWPEGVREAAEELADRCRGCLGESVVANLDAFTESVRQQAQAIVDEVVAASNGALLGKGAAEAKVDFVMWAPPDSDAHGRARVSVRLHEAPESEKQAPEAIVGQLDFRLKAVDVLITAGVDEFRALLAEHLPTHLRDLQVHKLGAFAERLRDSVFPDTSVKASIDEPTAKVQAAVKLLPKVKGAEELSVALEWDAAATEWRPADVSGLVDHGLELASKVTQALLVRDLAGKSAALTPYRPALKVALHPAGEEQHAQLPRSLGYNAHINLRSGTHGTEFELASLAVVCEQVGKAGYEIDVPAIEARLIELIAGVQEGYRRALLAELQRWSQTAPAPVTINTSPAAVREATDELRFELKPKSGGAQTLVASWDAGTFSYVFADPWRETGEALLGAVPEGFGDVEVEFVPAGQIKAGRRPVMLVGGMIGAAAVLSFAVWQFALRGPADTPTDDGLGGGTTVVTPTDTEPDEPRIVFDPEPEPPPEPVTEPEPNQVAISDANDANAVETVAITEPEPEPEPEPAGPTPAELAQELNEYLRERLQGDTSERPTFGTLFATLLPADTLQADSPASDAVAALGQLASLRGISNYQPAGEDRFTLDVQVALKVDAGGRTQTFVMERGNDAWLPSDENVENLTALVGGARTAVRSRVRAAREDIQESRAQGNLVAARRRLASVTGIMRAFEGDAEAEAVAALAQSLPPAWSELQATLAAYEPVGGLDPATGYPRQLRRGDGPALSLMSVPPADALWDELRALGEAIEAGDPLHAALQSAADNQSWRIYYMDSAERSLHDTYESALTESGTLGQAVPTRDEWFLSVLKLRGAGAAELVGGRFEWCADDTGDAGRHWVCGGASLSVGGQPRPMPRPPAGDDLGEWWRWLKHPLVMQTRSNGDNLTALRTVLRVFPPTGA